jgi:hypothetical protein
LSLFRDLSLKAFQQKDPDSLWKTHLCLFFLYSLHIEYESQKAKYQYNSFFLEIRSIIEAVWEKYDLFDTIKDKAFIPLDSPNDMTSIYTHSPAYSHNLFSFIETGASKEDFLFFFRVESFLNRKFFDFLIFALLGSEGGAKNEIAKNIWDECGNGRSSKDHIELFEKILSSLGLTRPLTYTELGWEVFAGINLFYYLSLHRRNYPALLGCMAVTEFLDPIHYAKVFEGCQRLGLTTQIDFEYYSSHVILDQSHEVGWVSRVIFPFLKKHPETKKDILNGVHWRLESVNIYYDALLNKLEHNRKLVKSKNF